MKNLFTALLAMLAMLAGAIPLTQSGTPLDFSFLPKHPGPWSVKLIDAKEAIVDANGAVVRAAGVNVTNYALLPTSMTQANNWTLKLYRMGVRAVRIHHWDIALLDHNWDAHKPRLDILVSSLKKRGIPIILDGNTQRLTPLEIYSDPAKFVLWEDQVRKFLTHVPTLENLKPYAQEPYVVGICPVNEDVYFGGATNDYYSKLLQKEIAFIRSLGYKGLIWGANAGIPDGWTIPGDLECWHRYTDHPWGTNFWDTKEQEQAWNWYKPRTQKPLICTEFGQLWPATNRGASERFMVDYGTSIGAQAMFPFAIATRAEHWAATNEPLDSYSFHNDPVRLATVRYTALRLNGGMRGLIYSPALANNSGFEAVLVSDGVKYSLVSPGTTPIILTVPAVTFDVPNGKSAYALDSDSGKILYKLPTRMVDGVRKADTSTVWTVLK